MQPLLRPRAAISLLALVGCATTTPSRVAPTTNARPSATTAPTPAHADAERLARIRTRLDALARDSIDFWTHHGLEPQYGGFYGTLDRSGAPIAPFDKGLIQEARHLWTFSTWYARREKTPQVRAIADNLYHFLVDHLRDPTDDEYFFKVSDAGAPIDKKKPLYAQSFAIYALSQYAATFDSNEAQTLALACFHSIDRRAHDPTYGGYDQANDPFYFTAGTRKQTNTHIHLLEAFTALYRLTHAEDVRQRLLELTRLTATRIVQPSAYAAQEFTQDFKPFGVSEVSYGHDIETSWLLLDALDALDSHHSLDSHERKDLHDIAIRLGRHAITAGFDPEHGGLFEAGEPNATPSKRDKIWWIQAETLPGLLRLYLAQPNQPDLERLELTLSFIENHLRDRQYGEWYWSTLADGSPSTHATNKGEEWKASYHTVRALVFTSDWIPR